MRSLWNSYHWHFIVTAVVIWLLFRTKAGLVAKSRTSKIARFVTEQFSKLNLKKFDNNKVVDLLWLLFKVAVPVVMFFYFLPGYTWILWKQLFWVDVAGVVIIYIIDAVDTPKKRGESAKVAICVILGVGNFHTLIMNPYIEKHNELEREAASRAVATVAKTNVPKAIRWDKETHSLTRKILFAELPVDQAAELYFVIGEESSGYNQFDTEGNVIQNGTAICAAQIKTDVWQEKADELGYDITTREGCLEMAAWIRKNDPRGIQNWEPTLPKITSYRTQKYVAPVGEWSDMIKVVPGCYWASDNTSIVIEDEMGVKHKLVPGSYPYVATNYYRIRSAEENEATLVLLCR